jgi:Protein of unknown function (DUF1569)
MGDLETTIADNHAAVAEFIAAARVMSPQQWITPREPGKWTPAQIAEHLAITYEYGRTLAEGKATGGIPFFLKPIARRMILDSTLKAGRFTRKGRTPKMFEPSATPPAASVVLSRLENALAGFERAVQSGLPESRQTLDHPFFGKIATTDYMRLQAIHARHHHAQLAASAHAVV